MQIPARHAAGNLIFNFDGHVWALYRIWAPTYGRMPIKEKLAWHTRVSAAIMSFPGESMILGVTQPIEPDQIAAAMVNGVDLKAHPRWADVSRDVYDALTEAQINERVTYVAFKLPSLKGAGGLRNLLGASVARFTRLFGIAALPVSRAVRKAATQLAADIAKPIIELLGERRMVAATENEIEWLYARAALRGIGSPRLSDFTPARDTVLSAARLAALGEPALFEGGEESDAGRSTKRYLRVDSERGSSFQAFAVLSHLPAEFTYPGGRGELLAHLDDSDDPVDWTVLIRPTTNAAARGKITEQIRKLAGQFKEYDGDLAGAPDSLNLAIDDMRALMAKLNAAPSTPECQTTIVLSFGAPSAAILEQRVSRLRAVLQANEFKLPRPLGQQADLWGATLPGAETRSVCTAYSQFMLPDDIAGCAPMTGSDLGDDRGALLGINLDAQSKPVLFWAGRGPSVPKPRGPLSGSIGIFGKLGSGKSFLVKRIIVDTIYMGGRVILTDRTPMGEYVQLRTALEGDGHTTQVVTLDADCNVCLDPLLVFTGEAAIRASVGFLTLLTGTDPTDPEYAVLDEAVRRVQRRGGRLRDVIEELRASSETDGAFARAADTVALKVQAVSRGSLAKVVFGDGRPVDLHADFSVFHAPNLQLPSAEALRNRRQLRPEHIFAQALLYLITAVAQDVAFRERHRFSLVVQDEGYVLDNPPGRELMEVVIRDGRKHFAALLFASHHPSDLDPTLQQMLGSRFLFRIDRTAAADGLRFMGMEVTSANLDAIDEAHRDVGQCFYRDLDARLGLIQVTQPGTAELREAFDTGVSQVVAGAGRRQRPAVGAGV